jgi:Ca2+-binding EF-hand superfamily protein
MQKALVLFLVATLLLAGCTELLDSGDGETKKIEINEDIAFEKINDFMTVDEGESFGITMMQEMDSNALVEMGVAVLDEDSDEDSDVMGTVEMTQAWSPDGYHTSRIMGIGNESSSIKMVSSMTQIGTTIYMEMGYEKLGDLCADEEEQEDIEDCKEEMASLTEVKAYSMTTTTTHTEIIAAMAEDTQNDGDDMNMMEMLEVFTFTECMGVFTPSTETVDGLQIFDVTMEDMEDSITPDMALCLFDTDNSDSISFEEFTASDDTEEGDVDEMRTVFDNADANANGELDSTELVTFIESMDSLEDEEEQMQDEDQSGEMPDMSVAFNNAGEIEYFGMSIDGNEVKMFVLTDKGVESIFANVDAGELVALPFYIGNEYDMDESDDEFMCNDGSTIPMSFVNDGDEDCDGGEDEDEFMCDDGSTIPMSFVNDGYDDCDGGEDEDTTDGSDNGGDNGEDQDSEDDGPSPQDLLDMTDTDDSGLMDFDEFITFMSESDETGSGPGESMPQSVIDEFEQMFNVSDLDESGDLDHDELEQFILDLTDYLDDDSGSDDDWMMWTFNRDMSECDSDNDGMVDFDELDACVTMDLANDGYGDEGVDGLRYMFDLVDADEDGMLDSDEFEDFAEMTSGEPMMVCYDRYADEIDSSVTSEEDCEAADFNWIQALQPVNEGEDDSEEDEFMCNDGSTIPMSFVNDGEEDCDGGEDEDDMGGSDDEFMCNDGTTIPMNYVNDGDEDCAGGEDEDDMGGSDGNTFYIETSQDVMIPFEGDMSDYKIELTTCRDDYNPVTMGSDTTCGESVMSIAISDAGENSDIMFHDADNSGTISVGDMIHIGETTGEWNTVRLYSISADAYSDENPIYNTPGFTGLVGMLALLGAAFIRRNE